jgi:hypothetical protein
MKSLIGGVLREQAVPVHPIVADPYGPKHHRECARGEHLLGRDLGVPEDLELSRAHLDSADEQLGARPRHEPPDLPEVDHPLQ